MIHRFCAPVLCWTDERVSRTSHTHCTYCKINTGFSLPPPCHLRLTSIRSTLTLRGRLCFGFRKWGWETERYFIYSTVRRAAVGVANQGVCEAWFLSVWGLVWVLALKWLFEGLDFVLVLGIDMHSSCDDEGYTMSMRVLIERQNKRSVCWCLSGWFSTPLWTKVENTNM